MVALTTILAAVSCDLHLAQVQENRTGRGKELVTIVTESSGKQYSQPEEGGKNMLQDVLLFTQNFEEAKAEIETQGGHIIHKFSPEAFVTSVPTSLDIASLQKSQSRSPRKLEPTVEAAVAAWKASIQKRERPSLETEGLSWDSPGYEPPGYDD